MQMVARVERSFESLRLLGIAGYLVQINDGIEMPRRANPCIDSFPIGLRCCARMVITRAQERQDRCAKDLKAMRVSADNHLLVGRSDVTNQRIVFGSRNFVLARERSDIVYAFEHDHVASGGLGEHIMIEARQSIGSKAIEQNAIAADPLI